jgi:GNAT superfamily N-acetyltransferase
MLFATTSLAARIERAEAAVARQFAEQARASGKDVLIEPIAGTTAIYGGPGEPFNKVVGLGFDSPLDADALSRLEAIYDARDAEIRVEQATLADPSVAVLLTRHGYELRGYENVMGLALTAEVVAGLSRDDAPAGEISITHARPDQIGLWSETAIEGFMNPDTFDGPPPTETFDRQTLRDIYAHYGGLAGCTLYFASRGGEIAGVGFARIDNGLVQLAGAATLPAHRRRGVQSALLRGRLIEAASHGCDLAVVTVEPASKSQQNMQRNGFALLYSRAVLVRPQRSETRRSESAER